MLASILANFRLDGERVLRLSTGKVVSDTPPPRRSYKTVSWGPRGDTHRMDYHRLKFALAYGYIPERVDHKDRDTRRNPLSNLRPATAQQNAWNSTAIGRKSSKPEPRGVQRRGNRFVARATHLKKNLYLGTFATAEQAHDAYLEYCRHVRGQYAPV